MYNLEGQFPHFLWTTNSVIFSLHWLTLYLISRMLVQPSMCSPALTQGIRPIATARSQTVGFSNRVGQLKYATTTSPCSATPAPLPGCHRWSGANIGCVEQNIVGDSTKASGDWSPQTETSKTWTEEFVGGTIVGRTIVGLVVPSTVAKHVQLYIWHSCHMFQKASLVSSSYLSVQHLYRNLYMVTKAGTLCLNPPKKNLKHTIPTNLNPNETSSATCDTNPSSKL